MSDSKRLEAIKAEIQKLPHGERLFGFREIKELPNILWEDEKLEKLVSGYYKGGNGILIATNKRIVFIDKGLVYGIRVEDFPYGKITSIEYKTGVVMGKITIFAAGNKAEIDWVDKSLVKDFSDFVRARTSGVKDHASLQKNGETAVPFSNDSEDYITQLERLATLKEKGILTEEEFAEQKKKILKS